MIPSRADLLKAALDVFAEQGYAATTLDQIAQSAKVDLTVIQSQFSDKDALLSALFTEYSPLDAMLSALDAVEGDSAEDIIRDTMRRLVGVFNDHQEFLDLAAIDIQANGGAFMSQLSTRILPKALSLFTRLKGTKQLRPVSDAILGRTLIAMLMGFVISEKAMPKALRVTMRLFPQRAWLDGMVDLLLFGVLEDDAR